MTKEYIKVEAVWKEDGKIIPAKVYLDGLSNNVKYQKIIPMETTKAGGTDLKYIVRLDGRPFELYLEYCKSYVTKMRWYRYKS